MQSMDIVREDRLSRRRECERVRRASEILEEQERCLKKGTELGVQLRELCLIGPTQ